MLRKLFALFNVNLPPLPSTPPAHQPNLATLLQLAGLIGIAVTLHFSIANTFVGLFALGAFLLKLSLIYTGRPAPPRYVMVLLTIASLAMILILYGGWNGQRAGISFLVLLVALKFLESRILRDYYVTCLILYFLAASSFLFDSSIGSISIVMCYTFAITLLLLKLSSPSEIKLSSSISSAGKIILKALPLAVFLFFFFPRIQGDFGFIPSQDQKAENELSDDLQAGDLAASAFNNSLAFRVEFDGRIPDYNKLYWRSKVMPIENNFRWMIKPLNPSTFISKNRKLNNTTQDQISYKILHEKSRDRYLPYLDYVTEYSQGNLLPNYSVWLRKPQSGAFTYQGSSTSLAYTLESDIRNRDLLLRTQSQPSARTQALLTQWRKQSNDPNTLVQTIFDYFAQNEFKYSLEPPILGNRPIDEFLFESKIGYCEHYASTFTTLARWLGIPARVVVGYHGGQINQTAQYMEVRYSDAHAWSEVWINNQWQRVDPTAAISPERIEYGMDAFMSLWDGSAIGSLGEGKSLSNYLNPTGVDHYYRQLKESWKNIGYQWNKWIINYDFNKQKELLANLGLEHRNSLYTLVGILFAGSLSLLLFYFWNQLPRPIKRTELQIIYLKFVQRFKRFDIIKQAADTPVEFANKAIARFPHLNEQINAITTAYSELRYGLKNDHDTSNINAFKKLTKQFKLSETNNETST